MKDTTIFLILPCYNEEEVICTTAEKLTEKLDKLISCGKVSDRSCMVFVDDGSADKTWDFISNLQKKNPERIRGLKFSANRGHQMAVLAGYNYAAGKCDAAISLDADLQHDIDAIDEFVEKFEAGNQIVYGVRKSRDTDGFFKKWTSQIFYRLMSKLGCVTIPNHADYRLVSNTVLKELLRYKEQSIFLRGIFPSIGYKYDYVYFEVLERAAGKSKYNFAKMLRLATDGITAFSIKPLYALWTEAVILFFLMLIFGVLTIIFKATWLLFMFCGLLFTDISVVNIAVVALYVGKINLEVKNRPQYIIEEILDND